MEHMIKFSIKIHVFLRKLYKKLFISPDYTAETDFSEANLIWKFWHVFKVNHDDVDLNQGCQPGK